MNGIVSTLVLAVALIPPGPESERAASIRTGPIKIDVAYAQQGNLYYYSLTAANYESQFSLQYAEYLRRPQSGEARTQFLVFNLPGSAGRELADAFVGLELSWNPGDYWFRVPENFAELPLEHIPCGVVAFNAQQLLGCPISPMASARHSTQANRLAWFIERLELTRYRFRESRHEATAEHSKVMLVRLFESIDGGQDVEVGKDRPSSHRRIPVGLILRTSVAEALVYGGLLEAPMSRPEVEIRRPATEWYAERLPQEDARRALLQALVDRDSHVRAAAAIALAANVAQNDSATIEAIRAVLQREPDPLVRQVIQNLLDGATMPPRDKQRNGS
ncbi:MAG: HEAT repeat domain-containing protein [Candidatus Binatia bacterium]